MKLRSLLGILLCVLICSPSAFAHAPAAISPIRQSQSSKSSAFNLGSTKQSFSAAALSNIASQLLRVGQHTLTVTDTSMLTAAEMVALEQLLGGGTQTLVLNNAGQAVGGSFQIGSLESQPVSSLYIPKGVTAMDTLASMNFSGNLVNAGDLLVFSSATNSHSAELGALNIYNLAGGLISSAGKTSYIGKTANPGQTFAVDLSLNAIDDLVNYGTIRSPGNLSIAVGGSILNGSSKPGILPAIKAANDINLTAGSGNITNAGSISSTAGNINVSTLQSTDLVFNNNGGSITALSGNINFRDVDYAGTANLTVTGGNLQANAVNIYSGQGVVDANVDQLQGVVNVSAQCAHITAATNVLDLGTMNISGDPTFYNTTGDVLISGDLIFPGQSLAIVAEGNIETTARAGIIDTSSSSGNGGSILMVAGANFTVSGGNTTTGNATSGNADNNSTLTITGGSGTGGTINLAKSGGITGIYLSSSELNGSGGSLQLIAYAGSDANSGNIILPPSAPIITGGNGTGAGGNVMILAGGPNATIRVGAINTLGGTGGGGSVFIATAAPTIEGQCSSCVVMVEGGAIDGCFPCTWVEQKSTTIDACTCSPVTTTSFSVYSIAGTFAPGTMDASGSIRTGNISSASVSITSSGNLFVDGSIDTTSAANSYSGGYASLTSASSNAFVVGGATVNGVAGTITIGSATVNEGWGGGLYIVNVESTGQGGGIIVPAWQNIIMQTQTAGIQVAGSNITLIAGGALVVPQGTLSVDGVAGGQGGSITMTADSITVQGPYGQPATQGLFLSANGSDGSPGGSVQITVNTGNISIGNGPGQIAISAQAGAATNGVTGANANPAGYGNGGWINLTNNGIGGINVSNPTDLSVQASNTGGGGGTIVLNAGNGVLTISQGVLSVDAYGSGTQGSGNNPCCSGGTILLLGAGLQVVGTNGGAATGSLNLTANGSSQGVGGSISISLSSGDLTIGSRPGQISISVQGESSQGANYSLDNSDMVNISTGGNLTVYTVALTTGDAPNISLVAGTQGQGNLLIKGSLIANGIAGQGGNIVLSANSSQAFVIGGATTNGVTGAIFANGTSLLGGAGGSVSVSNLGTGGITLLDLSRLSASASQYGGNGGSITLNAGSGALRISQGTLSVDGASSAMGSSDVNQQSYGGNIILEGSQIVVTAVGGGQASGTLNLSANGSVYYNAGSISLVTQSGDLTIGSRPGQIEIAAQGGSSSGTLDYIPPRFCWQYNYCCSGGESVFYTGKVFISAGGNLTVDPKALVVGPRSGTSANGAEIILIAGTGSGGGSLLVTGSISANGSGGFGGRIVLASASTDAFIVSASATDITNGVEGSVSATGQDGGTIILATGGTVSADAGALNASDPNATNNVPSTNVPSRPVILENPEYVSPSPGTGGPISGILSPLAIADATPITLVGDGSINNSVDVQEGTYVAFGESGSLNVSAACCSPNPNGSIIKLTFVQAQNQGYLCCAGPQLGPTSIGAGLLATSSLIIAINNSSGPTGGTTPLPPTPPPSSPPSPPPLSPAKYAAYSDSSANTPTLLTTTTVTSLVNGSFLLNGSAAVPFNSSLASLFSKSADSRPSLSLGLNEAIYHGDGMILTEVNSTPNSLPPVSKSADDTVIVDTGDSETW